MSAEKVKVAGCTSLTKVDCRSKVLSKIGISAFQGDKKLRSFILKTTKPKKKSVGKNAFKGTHKKLVIKTPKKVRNAYQAIFRKKGNAKARVK